MTEKTNENDDINVLDKETFKEFKKLVQQAEKFIVKSSGDILFTIRNKVSKTKKASEKCYELLSYKQKYFPKFFYNEKNKQFVKRTDKKHFMEINDIIMQFCQELQNYRGMKKAIDYLGYSYNIKNNTIDYNTNENKILKAVIKFYEEHDKSYFDDKKDKRAKENNQIKTKNDKKFVPLSYNFDLYKFLRDDETYGLHFGENSELKGKGLDILKGCQNCRYKGNDDKDKEYDFEVDRYKKKYSTKDSKITYEAGAFKCYLYNSAWYRYTAGLMDVLIQMKTTPETPENYLDFVKIICKEVKEQSEKIAEICKKKEGDISKELDKEFNELDNIIHKFNGNTKPADDYRKIFCLGDTLTYDFLKELACENLVKADIHIKELFRNTIYNNQLPSNDNAVAKHFIKLCNNYKANYHDKDAAEKYTPFYIDKMFWLCCTGYFYADGITIAKMTRNNFLRFAGYEPIQDEDEEQEE